MSEQFNHYKQGKVSGSRRYEICRTGYRNFSQQKSPGKTGAFLLRKKQCSDFSYVRGLKPFRTLSYLERYSISFSKGFKSVAGNCGEMAKYIFTIFLL